MRLPTKLFVEESDDDIMRKKKCKGIVEYFNSVNSTSSTHKAIDKEVIEVQKQKYYLA